MKRIKNIALIIFLIALDQIIKLLICTFIAPKASSNLIGEFVKLTFATNTGGAYSIRKKQYNFYNSYQYCYTCSIRNIFYEKL